MRDSLKQKWLIPVATVVMTLSIGSVAFAATGSSSTDTTAAATTDTTIVSTVTTAAATTDATAASATDSTAAAQKAPDSSKPWGNQRSDETLVTGDLLTKLTAAAEAKVSGGTVVRVETDADGNAKYEVHMTKADGTLTTVYFDADGNYVSTIDGGGGGGKHANDNDADDAATSTAASTSTSAVSSSTSSN